VVLRAAEGWPETAYHGKRAARSFYEGLVETVGGEAVIEELIDAGEIVFHPRTPTCEVAGPSRSAERGTMVAQACRDSA
jgi:hypothetical protein